MVVGGSLCPIASLVVITLRIFFGSEGGIEGPQRALELEEPGLGRII